MIISRLSITYETFSRFTPHAPFIYVSTISQLGYEQSNDFTSDFAFTAISGRRTVISNFYTFSGGTITYYTNRDDYNSMVGDEESFYFDVATQLLYIHIDHDIKPDSDTVVLAQQKAYTGASKQGVWYDQNDIEYLPKLLTYPEIAIEADPLEYSKIAFQNFSIEYDNTIDSGTEGEFDNFKNSPIPGSESTLSYISEDWFNREELNIRVCDPTASEISTCDPVATDETKCTPDEPLREYDLYTGIVDGDYIDEDVFTVNLIDKRSKDTKKIPETKYNTTDYPQILDTVKGKVIAEGYGTVRGLECFCLTGTTGSGNQTYKFATDATSVTTVYVENDGVYESVTPVSTDATNGEFVLSASDSLTSGGSPKKVKADVVLRNITNPGDIIADINNRYLGNPYDSTNYNTTKWAEKSYLEDVGFAMTKQEDIFKIIEKIQNGSDYGFRYDIDGSGKRFLRVDLLTRTSADSIDRIDITNNPGGTRDFTKYASSVQVNYGKDYKADEYFNVTNLDFFNDTIKSYGYNNLYEVDSLLATQAHAEAKALNIATNYSTVKPLFNVHIKDITFWDYDIYQFLDVDLSEPIISKQGRTLWGEQKCKILGKTFSVENEEIILKLQGGY